MDILTPDQIAAHEILWEDDVDRSDEELGRIDGIARIRIEDHIRECGLRYERLDRKVSDVQANVQSEAEELKESIRRLHARLDDASKARFTLLAAIIVAALSGVFNLVLHFLPTGHP